MKTREEAKESNEWREGKDRSLSEGDVTAEECVKFRHTYFADRGKRRSYNGSKKQQTIPKAQKNDDYDDKDDKTIVQKLC